MPMNSCRQTSWRMARSLVCTVALTGTPVFGATLDTDSLSPEAVEKAEKAAVASRKAIRSGHFVVVVSYNAFIQDPDYTKTRWRYELFVNGQNERTDLKLYASSKLGTNSRCVSSKDLFIRATLSDDSLVECYGRMARPAATLETIDPRLLGFVPRNVATMKQSGLEECVLRKDRSLLSAKRIQHEGETFIEVSYKIGKGAQSLFGAYRLAIDKGYQPVYVATWSGEGAHKTFHSAESTLKYHESNDLWFPSEVVYRSEIGGKLATEEVAAVEHAEINKKIYEQVFTLIGLGLKPGRLVDRDGQLMWWTGGGLRPKKCTEDKYHPEGESWWAREGLRPIKNGGDQSRPKTD